MRVLVTGGNGFIGSHLVDRLLIEGHDVTVCDRRQRLYERQPEEVVHLESDFRALDPENCRSGTPDIVYHLAWGGFVEKSVNDLAGDVQSNLAGIADFLERCRKSRVGRFVFVSSGGSVYGVPDIFPTPEHHRQDPVSGYGITKLAAEKYVRLFQVLYGMECAILRPSVVYGPRQNPHDRHGAAAVFLYRIANGLPLTIWGDGSAERDFAYVTDLTDALIRVAAEPLACGGIFNIGGGTPVSLQQLVSTCESVCGKNAHVEYSALRRFDIPRVWLDTNRARKELDWSPRFTIHEGLRATWRWMESSSSLLANPVHSP